MGQNLQLIQNQIVNSRPEAAQLLVVLIDELSKLNALENQKSYILSEQE
jgi:hypothetical protein